MKPLVVGSLLVSAAISPSFASSPQVEELTVAKLQKALAGGQVSCREIVQAHLARIAAYDDEGPRLNAILTLSPTSLARADELDAAFAKSGPVGPLHCVPVILKDNFNTKDLPTTLGSAALEGMQPTKDAFVVDKLRQAGAVIIGKANLHEFAASGTTASSLGGQTLNPYDLTRTPGGSSGGTGAAVAASFVVLGTGSDTVNSIRSPASAAALVGFRPTRGLLSRAGIAPVSETQDAIGPIGRTVEDVARMLEVMQGDDPQDPATAASRGKAGSNYLSSLDEKGLAGARIGVLRQMFGTQPEHQEVNAAMASAIETMRKAGAQIIEIDEPGLDAVKLGKENDVQKYEFKTLMNAYLASIPDAPEKTVSQVIASGKYHRATLDKFLKEADAVENGMQDPEYQRRLERNARTRQAVETVMDAERLDAIVYPLQKRLVVPIKELNQADRNGHLASVTGLPALDIPAGFSSPTETAPIGVPIGMDFLGRAWSEATLLRIAYAFEQTAKIRKPPLSTPALKP
jgi:Asp-tRNA(Asn)/Glu-tRNA(Gln) amidotransferase A subunit family amidase